MNSLLEAEQLAASTQQAWEILNDPILQGQNISNRPWESSSDDETDPERHLFSIEWKKLQDKKKSMAARKLMASDMEYEGERDLIYQVNRKRRKKKMNLMSMKKIQGMSCGKYHFFFWSDAGTFCFGDNSFGQLGIGPEIEFQSKLAKWDCFLEKNYVQVFCGCYHTIFLVDYQKIYACGKNQRMQLGLGHTDNVYIPEELTFLPDPVSIISVSYYQTILVTRKNEIFVMGNHFVGEIPKYQVSVFKFEWLDGCTIEQVVSGGCHSFFLVKTKEMKLQVYAMGLNGAGQLGIDSMSQVPLKIDFFDEHPVKSISCGYEHSIFLLQSGEIYVAGSNEHSQLGLTKRDGFNELTCLDHPLLKDKVITNIACSDYNTVFVTGCRRIYVCGEGFGKLIDKPVTHEEHTFVSHLSVMDQTFFFVNSPIHEIIPTTFNQSRFENNFCDVSFEFTCYDLDIIQMQTNESFSRSRIVSTKLPRETVKLIEESKKGKGKAGKSKKSKNSPKKSRKSPKKSRKSPKKTSKKTPKKSKKSPPKRRKKR